MELNESGGLSSYYHYHHHQPPNPSLTAATSPTNGIAPNSAAASSHAVYPGSVPSAVSSPLETVKRKRGRPRKYGSAEQAAVAKRMSSASSSISPPKKREQGLLGGGARGGTSHSFTKRSQLSAFGDAGRGFTAHIINVVAGEDVGQKIMAFAQQSKHEMCILSVSGTISNAFLLQPGGNVTYEGRFDILSLSGSYARNGPGRKTGGLSICLASGDGQIIGGGVGGPLIAAGPIQVIVGTFAIDKKKNLAEGLRRDVSAQIDVVSTSDIGVQSMVDSSHQSIVGNQFMMQSAPPQSTEWRGNTPENSDYDHLGD
ncbi:PREDICTED: AT-hook motif nuclear-localized protein 14 [Ipomoea nil]|uniref:AT-hook motif nuclear-localized protein 14 n=1 Tax=Ipomoea nil TaxID=35883 RepID=UPI0009015CC3|nr:PREDICTED: AT-hook motif nuclear-localized protein 14 [Ipomoea nil]